MTRSRNMHTRACIAATLLLECATRAGAATDALSGEVRGASCGLRAMHFARAALHSADAWHRACFACAQDVFGLPYALNHPRGAPTRGVWARRLAADASGWPPPLPPPPPPPPPPEQLFSIDAVSTCGGTPNDPTVCLQSQCFGDSPCCNVTGICTNSAQTTCSDALKCTNGPCAGSPPFPPAAGGTFQTDGNSGSPSPYAPDGCQCEFAVANANCNASGTSGCWGMLVCPGLSIPPAVLANGTQEAYAATFCDKQLIKSGDCCVLNGDNVALGFCTSSQVIAPTGGFCVGNGASAGSTTTGTFKMCGVKFASCVPACDALSRARVPLTASLPA